MLDPFGLLLSRGENANRTPMKTAKTLLAALLLALAVPFAAADAETFYGATIFGEDERRPFNRSAAERDLAKKIGGVVGGHGATAQRCTAALVGPDLVAFAAHCIYDAEAGKPRVAIDSLRYFPRWPHLEEMIPIEGPDSLWIGERFLDKAPSHDWAIMRLARPADPALGYLESMPFRGSWAQRPGVRDEEASGKISLIAFHQDLYAEVGPMISPNCNVYRIRTSRAEPGPNPALFFHDCDAAPGASGGAFVARNGEGKWALVGIQKGVRGDLKNFRPGEPFDYERMVSIGVGAAAFHDLLQKLRR